MAETPYRAPAELPPEPIEAAPPSVGLGKLRRSHPFKRNRGALAVPATSAVAVGAVGLAVSGVALAAGLGLPFGALVFAFYGWPSVWYRSLVVDVHEHGLVVRHRDTRREVHWEQVDEVWYVVDREQRTLGVSLGELLAVRLVLHGRTTVDIPATVENADGLVDTIARHCTEPLVAEARRRLLGGEMLRFGRISLGAERIVVDGDALSYDEVDFVRVFRWSVAVFGKKGLLARQVPWRTVYLDQIPHARLFVQLLSERVRHVERG